MLFLFSKCLNILQEKAYLLQILNISLINNKLFECILNLATPTFIALGYCIFYFLSFE